MYPIGMSLGYDIYEDIGLLYNPWARRDHAGPADGRHVGRLREPEYEDCSDALIDLAGVKTTPKIAEMRELIAMLKQQRGPPAAPDGWPWSPPSRSRSSSHGRSSIWSGRKASRSRSRCS